MGKTDVSQCKKLCFFLAFLLVFLYICRIIGRKKRFLRNYKYRDYHVRKTTLSRSRKNIITGVILFYHGRDNPDAPK